MTFESTDIYHADEVITVGLENRDLLTLENGVEGIATGQRGCYNTR
jgi:hypothetical protein